MNKLSDGSFFLFQIYGYLILGRYEGTQGNASKIIAYGLYSWETM